MLSYSFDKSVMMKSANITKPPASIAISNQKFGQVSEIFRKNKTKAYTLNAVFFMLGVLITVKLLHG